MSLVVSQMSKQRLALTIAGFDPSGGAGVLADVRTFAAFELAGVAAITSLTFQNSKRVVGVHHQTGAAVRSQLLPLIEEGGIVCAKTGMLPTIDIVVEVSRLFRETNLAQPVVDPVIMSSSGHLLMEENALEAMVKELFPLSRLITPNISEAEKLTGISINSESDMLAAAERLRETGARAVLVKGGHLPGDAIDLLDDDGAVTVFCEPRVERGTLHGSGCVLSAAIAACVGQGMSLKESVGAAKRFVLEAIRRANK